MKRMLRSQAPGYVRNLIDLQFSDPYFTGTQWDFKTETIRNFTFDTKTRTYHFSDSGVHATFEDMATRAQQDRSHILLEAL